MGFGHPPCSSFVKHSSHEATSGQTASSTTGSAPATDWQQEYGNNRVESVSNVVQTSDGGYAFLDLGWAYQFTFTPATFYKVDSSGNVQWQKTFNLFSAASFVQTSDGGYTILGAWSTYGTTYENTPTLIKTDSEGDIKSVENYSTGIGGQILLTSDGGFAVLSGGANLLYYPGTSSATITKTDSNGNIQWIKDDVTFPSLGVTPSLLDASSLIETSDGALAGLGIGNPDGNPRMGTIYLFKTEAFLPLPTPSPTPIPTPTPTRITLNSSASTLVVSTTIVIVLIITVFLLFYLRKNRKSKKKLTA